MRHSIFAKHQTKAQPTNPLYSLKGLYKFSQELKSKNAESLANQNSLAPSLKFRNYFQNKIHRVIVKLKDTTHFTEHELTILSYVYYRINNKSKYLCDKDFEDFLYLTYDITDSIALAGITRYFKKDQSKSFLKLSEFLLINSILLRGIIEEQTHLMFTILDFNHNQHLEKYSEIAKMTNLDDNIVHFKLGFDPEEPHRDILEMFFKRVSPKFPSSITFKEILKACKNDNLLLESLTPFLPHESRRRAIETILFGEHLNL